MTKVIYDNDGVNIDSEDVAMRVMDDWGCALVFRFRPDADLKQDYIYTKWPGTSTDRIVDAIIAEFNLPRAKIAKAYGFPNDANLGMALADLITIETNERFKADLKALPGTTKALTEVRETFGPENVALATTSRADRMDISLAHAKDPETGENARLEEMFPAGPQRRSGFGHNNKYDEAFGALGWNPAETIVVEDSTSGVKKAKDGRPGVRVLGIVAARFYTNKEKQAVALLAEGANLVISNKADEPKALLWIESGMDAKTKPDFKSSIYYSPSAFKRPSVVVTTQPGARL